MKLLSRRGFIGLCAVAVAVPLAMRFKAAAAETFEVTKTDAEWKALLTPAQYHVLREEGTELPGSSPLDHFYEAGTYDCQGCDLPLFSSQTKFNSHTGWPSFYAPLPNAVATRRRSEANSTPTPTAS